MDLHNIHSAIQPYWERLKLSPKQKLFTKFFTVGVLMAFGAAGVISGVFLLGLMVASQSIIGIIISALSVSFGAGFVIAGYLWFTL